MKKRSEIAHNCRLKSFPDGSREILIANRDIFVESGWELADKWGTEKRGKAHPADSSESIARAKRRARTAVHDLALCNAFSYFVTLTLSPDKVNRYDAVEVTMKLNAWLDNAVRRKGLKYVLVPELHRDGAIHFHGFFNDALPVTDSGTVDIGTGKPRKPRSAAQRAQWLRDGGHVVYNLPTWTLGFTTAIELYGDRRAAVGYVVKYITKADAKVGGRWYYSGGALQRPEVELCDAEYADFLGIEGASEFTIDALDARVVHLVYDGGGKAVET